jgi:hypothetical protein
MPFAEYMWSELEGEQKFRTKIQLAYKFLNLPSLILGHIVALKGGSRFITCGNSLFKFVHSSIIFLYIFGFHVINNTICRLFYLCNDDPTSGLL